MDARLEDRGLHDEAPDASKWMAAAVVSSSAWSRPTLKETAALERQEVFPARVEAVGTVTPSRAGEPPHPEIPTSWLAKHSGYERDRQRAVVTHHSVARLLPGPDGYATLDFGKPVHGYLHLEIADAPAGAVLDFTYGEIRQDLHGEKPILLSDGSFDPEFTVGSPSGDRVVLRAGAQSIEIPEERTLRWLMVTWRQATAPIEIGSISIMTSQHPAPELGSFEVDLPEIPQFVQLCLDHARVTMSDTYVDTPGREDAQWLEDIQYRAQLAAQWFGDTALRQVTLRHTVEQQVPSGRFRVFSPEDYGAAGMQSLDWGIVWIGMLYDDWMWTGETTRVRRYFSNLVRFLEVAHSQTNADGLLVDRTCMTDLRSALRASLDDGEIESIPNAWYHGFLGNAIELAVAIGETAQSLLWQDRATRVRRGFQRFISSAEPTRGLIGEVWSPLDGVKGFGQAAAVSAVFHNIVPPKTGRLALEAVFDARDGSPPPGVGRWNNPTYAYRALRALSDHAMGEIAGAHFLERYRPYLPDGPLPEYFLPGSGQPEDPTGSHGWAAVPLAWLHDTVLGVRLANPGGSRIIWSPVDVGWRSVRGTTITPHGPCEVEIDWMARVAVIRTPEQCEVEVRLPEGVKATVHSASGPEVTAKIRRQKRSVPSLAIVAGETSSSIA
jgi:hypothetical protein